MAAEELQKGAAEAPSKGAAEALPKGVTAALPKGATEALPKDAAAAQPYFGWGLLVVGILLVVGLAAAAWWWWRKRSKTQAASGEKVLSRNSLVRLRKQFLDAQPLRYRSSVSDFPTVVVLGPDDNGRPKLIEQEVDWRRQQNQFMPSYTDGELVKFYLGPDSVVQEISERLLRDGSRETRTALNQLWKDSLGWRKRVLAVIALDARWLRETLPDDVRSFTQLLRGKINLLAEICKRPVETRICLTNMDRVEGFSQFARLLKENRVPPELTVPAAGQEAQLGDSLRPMEKYLTLGLVEYPIEDFKPLEKFFVMGRDVMIALKDFIIALREGGTLSIPPQLEKVYLTPDPEARPVGAFTLVAEKKSPDLRKHNRQVHLRRCALILAVGCLPVLAAYANFYRLLVAARNAVAGFELTVSRLEQQGVPVSGEVIKEQSRNAMDAMWALWEARRFWPPLATSFEDDRAALRMRLASTLRTSYFKPYLENCQRQCGRCESRLPGCPAPQGSRLACPGPKPDETVYYHYEESCRPEQVLYMWSALHASREDALGESMLAQIGEGDGKRMAWAAEVLNLHVKDSGQDADQTWLDTVSFGEDIVGDYIVFSDTPWDPNPQEAKTWARWPFQPLTLERQVQPWQDHFSRLSQWIEGDGLDMEAWRKMQDEREQLEKLLRSSQYFTDLRSTLDLLNASPTRQSESTLPGINTTLEELGWMRAQRGRLGGALALELEADEALHRGLEMAPAQLLTQSTLFVPKRGDAEIVVSVLDNRPFVFVPSKVSQQMLQKLVRRLKDSPALAFGTTGVATQNGATVSVDGTAGGGEVVSASVRMAPGGSQRTVNRSNFETELKPLVDEFTELLAKANMPQEEAAANEAYVVKKVGEFATLYREGLLSAFSSYQFNASRSTLLSELSRLVQPSSPLNGMLRDVWIRASIGPLEGPYYEPLRNVVDPYKPVIQLMTPDKDGNYAALAQYILLVAQLHGELSGTRVSADKASAPKASADKAGDSGKSEEASTPAAPAAAEEPQLYELLSPTGRVALSMMLEDDSSYLKKVDAWLDKQGILGEFRTPFRQPFLKVRDLGRDDIEKVLKEQWAAERKRVLDPLLKRYPFDPNAQLEIDPAELSVLSRKDGELWQFVDQVLSPVIVERGTDWSLRGALRNQLLLPARMLSTLNQVSRLSRTLWNDEGKPVALAMQLRPLPLPSVPAHGEFVTMSYVKCGGASAFGFNQSPAWQDFSLSWWDQRSASLGLELRSPQRSAKRYRTVEVPSSSWSCLRLLEMGTLTAEQNMVWELPAPEGHASADILDVSFGLRGNPWALFRGVPR
jgi:type VI secretion system protein ImpL